MITWYQSSTLFNSIPGSPSRQPTASSSPPARQTQLYFFLSPSITGTIDCSSSPLTSPVSTLHSRPHLPSNPQDHIANPASESQTPTSPNNPSVRFSTSSHRPKNHTTSPHSLPSFLSFILPTPRYPYHNTHHPPPQKKPQPQSPSLGNGTPVRLYTATYPLDRAPGVAGVWQSFWCQSQYSASCGFHPRGEMGGCQGRVDGR